MASSIRKAQVDQATPSGQLAHIHADGGVGGPPPNRPFVGGISTGLHYQPQSGDGIVVLGEDAIVGNFPVATVSAAPLRSTLPTMAAGETAIYGADGRVISYVKADGTTTLWSKIGKPSTTVDANGNLTVGGTLNGQNISSGPATLDVNGHVLQQAVYDPAEASTMDTLGSTSIIINNLNRLRNQLGVVIGNAGSAWNAAVQMIPLSQKGAASGVAPLTAQKLLDLSSAGTPTVTVGAAAGTGASASVVAGSTDARGVIQINTGTGPTSGNYATVSFSTTLSAAPKVILPSWIGPAVGNPITIDSITTSSFQILTTTLAASTTYKVQYLVAP